ncbi:MAG: hypothetical protein EXX96DRAFT_615277 [Benjaminiella poitrasii]|nr:MAG: hypothetical protein EXX96DRAFT_615277 [Benjaminiella poitrasii]
MKEGLGCDYTTFTRKLRLEGSTNTDYLTKLQNNIITTDNGIRQIIHRYQLFLIIGKTITNKNAVPSNLTTFWNTFKEQHPNIIYSKIETFEKRLIAYLNYKIQNLFAPMPIADIPDISKRFCYQFICFGSPEWPSND